MIDDHPIVTEEIIYTDRVGHRLTGLPESFLGVYRARSIKGNGVLDETLFVDVIFDAAERGSISDAERREVFDIRNNVLRGENRRDGSPVYAAIAITATLSDGDIRRAADGAGIVQRACGQTAIPAVVGARIDDARRRLARERGVVLIHVGLAEVKMIDRESGF